MAMHQSSIRVLRDTIEGRKRVLCARLLFAAVFVPACTHGHLWRAQAMAGATDAAPAVTELLPAPEAGAGVAELGGSGGEPGEVGLEELLAFAEQNAPALQVALRSRDYGGAAREGDVRFLRESPSLDLGVGPRFGDGNARDFDFTATLTQTVEIAGQRRLRLDAADRLSDQLDAQIAAARWELRRQVVLSYRSAAVARERVRLADRLLSFAEEIGQIARRRLAAGEASAIDVRIAEADLAQARQAQILAARDLWSTRLTLCEITGWPIDRPPLPRAGLDRPRPVPSLPALLALAAEKHPEVRARRAAVAAAQARVAIADREAWGTPSVGITMVREGQGAAGEESNYVVLGAIGLPIPLWQRNQAERAQARVDEQIARAQESATTQAMQARIARAHAELGAAAERLELFTSAIAPPLEEGLSLLRRGLDAGEIPLLDVALARERLLKTQLDALSAYEDYYRALIELEFVVGAELPLSADDTGRATR